MTEPERKAWWLIVQRHGGQLSVWHLGDAIDRNLADRVDAARVVMDIPAGDNTGWDVQLGYDEPHHTLMARAEIRDPGELLAVTPTALETYRTAVHEAGRQGRLAAARSALGALTEDEVETILQGGG